MDLLPTLSTFALPAAVLALLLLAARMRQRSVRDPEARDDVDTVVGWPPEVARVLTIDERQAYDLLHRAVPGSLVLAQVPLSRFIRVPLRRSYGEWLQRVGSLSADLLLCDSGSRVLAVVDIRAPTESERSRRRHERMTRVLRKAGIHVLTWREGGLPSVAEVRVSLAPLLGTTLRVVGKGSGSGSRPMPLIPVAEMEEILAEGDREAAAAEFGHEPVPSGFFDDLEAAAPRHRSA